MPAWHDKYQKSRRFQLKTGHPLPHFSTFIKITVGGGDFRGHFRRDKGAMGASLRSCREAGDNTTPPPSEAAAFANPMGGDAVSTLHQFLNPV
jgi:hypothetical protein